jgi:hypothetical protein
LERSCAGEGGDEASGALCASGSQRSWDLRGLGAVRSFVAAGDFAGDHRGAQLAFGQIIGGINAIVIQKGEEMIALFIEPIAQGFFVGLAAHRLHPLATQAILELAYFPINHTRVGSLKRPLSRWLTSRMNHNYRQARKDGYIDQDGYHIALKTILEERALPRESRLRDNVDSVREALAEMKQRRILAQAQPYNEKLTHASTKGRPKIADAVWTLYPSAEFVDEVINGNKEMSGSNRGRGK